MERQAHFLWGGGRTFLCGGEVGNKTLPTTGTPVGSSHTER